MHQLLIFTVDFLVTLPKESQTLDLATSLSNYINLKMLISAFHIEWKAFAIWYGVGQRGGSGVWNPLPFTPFLHPPDFF